MPTTRTRVSLTDRDRISLRYVSNDVTYGQGSQLNRISIQRNNLTSSVTYGDNIPDWKRRIARGQDATTTLIGTVYDSWGKLAGVSAFDRDVKILYSGPKQPDMSQWHFGSPLAFIPNVSTSFSGTSLSLATSVAMTRAIKQALKVQRMFNGGVFLGEFAETLRMIKRPASSLRNETDKLFKKWDSTYKKVRNSRDLRNLPSSSVRVTRALKRAGAGTWLEWSFGVRPLVADVRDAAQAAAELTVKARPAIKVVNGRYTDRVSAIPGPISYDLDSIKWLGSYVTITEMSSRFQLSVICDMGGSELHSTLGLLGVDFTSIVPTVWELIPYSFLVDYFTNIGDVLEAFSFRRSSMNWAALHTARSRSNELVSVGATPGTVAFGWKRDTFIPGRPLDSPGDYYDPGFRGLCGIRYREISRSPYTGSLIPSIRFEMPGFKSRKWLNIGALLLQRNQASRYRVRGS